MTTWFEVVIFIATFITHFDIKELLASSKYSVHFLFLFLSLSLPFSLSSSIAKSELKSADIQTKCWGFSACKFNRLYVVGVFWEAVGDLPRPGGGGGGGRRLRRTWGHTPPSRQLRPGGQLYPTQGQYSQVVTRLTGREGGRATGKLSIKRLTIKFLLNNQRCTNSKVCFDTNQIQPDQINIAVFFWYLVKSDLAIVRYTWTLDK